MTVKQHACVTVTCDGCNTDVSDEYVSHWPSTREAIDDAVNGYEWWGNEKFLLCDRCRHKPHDIVPDGDTCARCGAYRAEHDPEEMAAVLPVPTLPGQFDLLTGEEAAR